MIEIEDKAERYFEKHQISGFFCLPKKVREKDAQILFVGS